MSAKKSYRALIVDDSDDFRILTARALARERIQSDEAADGIVAENLLRIKRYDIILCDLRMPRKHGHKLIQELLDKPSPPAIIAITGLTEPRLVADLVSRGVIDVMQKPIIYDVFAAKLRAMLERRERFPEGRPSGSKEIASQIEETASRLRSELSGVTKSFESSIKSLERQKEDIEQGYLGSLRVLTNMINQFGETKGSHAGRVEEMSGWIAERCGLSADQVRDVKIAALLHDIGQFGMPDAIRLKPPWALNELEREIYEKYPLIGATLLSELKGADRMVELIESHAEHYDGSGFPSGRAGAQIPLGARIIHVADAFDTFRVFAPGEASIEHARQHLIEHKGTHFDPEVLGHAIAFLQEFTLTEETEASEVIAASELSAGLVLAEDIYDNEGRFLARQGAKLSDNMLLRLRRLLRDQRIRVYPRSAE